MSPSSGELEEEEDDDAIIKKLREELVTSKNELKDARLEIETLKQELWREKDINNALLSERKLRNNLLASPCHSQQISPSDSQQSPVLTCAQRERPAPASPVDVENSGLDHITDSVSSVDHNGDYGETTDNGSPISETAELHESDITRSKKLVYFLKSFKNIPRHRKVVIFGDSNLLSVQESGIDPKDKSVIVRGCSGLCVPAAVYALQQCSSRFNHIKKVVWSLGTNDFLHRDQHCPDDWQCHLENLIRETHRIFPYAKIGFILPFHGLPKIPQEVIKFMDESVKKITGVPVKRYNVPSMRNKVQGDGVHITAEGAHVFEEFVRNTFLGRSNIVKEGSRATSSHYLNHSSSSSQQENSHGTTPSSQHQTSHGTSQQFGSHSGNPQSYTGVASDRRPGMCDFGNVGFNQQFYQPPPPIPPQQFFRPHFPMFPNLQGQMVREISEAVAAAMLTRQHGGDAGHRDY